MVLFEGRGGFQFLTELKEKRVETSNISALKCFLWKWWVVVGGVGWVYPEIIMSAFCPNLWIDDTGFKI